MQTRNKSRNESKTKREGVLAIRHESINSYFDKLANDLVGMPGKRARSLIKTGKQPKDLRWSKLQMLALLLDED